MLQIPNSLQSSNFHTLGLNIVHFGLFVALSLPASLFLLSLSICFIFGFPLDSGNRAQLSADAGQRRPSQKEKYVSP